MAGSQKITIWAPQRTPLGILRVNNDPSFWGFSPFEYGLSW